MISLNETRYTRVKDMSNTVDDGRGKTVEWDLDHNIFVATDAGVVYRDSFDIYVGNKLFICVDESKLLLLL